MSEKTKAAPDGTPATGTYMRPTAPLVRCVWVVSGEVIYLSPALFESAAAHGAVVLCAKGKGDKDNE